MEAVVESLLSAQVLYDIVFWLHCMVWRWALGWRLEVGIVTLLRIVHFPLCILVFKVEVSLSFFRIVF